MLGVNDDKHAESKCEVEALDKLILEIMPLDHAESRQRFLAHLEHKLCADGLAAETDVKNAGKGNKTQNTDLKNDAPKS